MVIDTDSDWTIVTTKECDSCGSHSYNSIYSTSKKYQSFDKITLDYVDAEASGTGVLDKVCIAEANSNCMGQLEFLAMKD
jgi:hypothetical protein